MFNFWVELDAKEVFIFIYNSGILAVFSVGHHFKSFWYMSGMITMTHPSDALVRQAFKDFTFSIKRDYGFAIFTSFFILGGHNFAT